MQGATIFEFEASPESEIHLQLNGLQVRDTVQSFAARSRVLWCKDECVRLVQETTGLRPEDVPGRADAYYLLACKAKLHRLIPEAGFCAAITITDDEPLSRETHYRVRVEQRNGQRAWSSPIWVRPQVPSTSQ